MQPPTPEEVAEANTNAEGGEDPKKNIRKKRKAQFKRPAKFAERLGQEEEDDKEEKPKEEKQEDDMSALGFMGTRSRWRRGALPLYFWCSLSSTSHPWLQIRVAPQACVTLGAAC